MMVFDLQPSYYKVKIHKHQKYHTTKESDKRKLHRTKHKDQHHSSDIDSSVYKNKSSKRETIKESHNIYHKLNKLLEDIDTLSDSSKSSGERKSIKKEILTKDDEMDQKHNKLNAASFKEMLNGEQALNHFNLPTKTHSKKKIIHTYNESETGPELYIVNRNNSLEHAKIKKKKKRHHTDSESDIAKKESKSNHITDETKIKKKKKHHRTDSESDIAKKESRSNHITDETKIKTKKERHHTDSESDIAKKESKSNHITDKTKIKKKKERHRTDSESDIAKKESKGNHITDETKNSSLAEMENSFDYDSIRDALEFNDSRLSEEHRGMLSQLVVELPWPVPPSHLVETRMSTHPLKEQQEILKQEFNMRTTKYTPQEDNRIKRNWNKFCELHQIPKDPEPFLAFEALRNSKIKGSVLSKSERINFVRFLGHRLDHRCLFSIYRRFKKLFAKNIKGRFSAAEDNIILNYIQKSKETNKFAQLAVILNRDRHAILLRHKKLVQRTYNGGHTLDIACLSTNK